MLNQKHCPQPADLENAFQHIAARLEDLLAGQGTDTAQQDGAQRIRELCRFQRAGAGEMNGRDRASESAWRLLDLLLERGVVSTCLANMLVHDIPQTFLVNLMVHDIHSSFL